MKIFIFLSLLAAVRAVVVPLVDSSGHFHPLAATDVAPRGKNITLNGVLTYVTLPEGNFDPTTAVLLLTGKLRTFHLLSRRLRQLIVNVIDQTYAPDYLNGDALPPDGNTTAWLVNHSEAVSTPPILTVISALKSQGVKQIAVTGYCFGGFFTTRLIQNNTVVVGTMAHPSGLNVPTDFELMKAQSHVPVEINNAELDTGFTPALGVGTDAVMDNGQYPPGYFRRQFDGVGHGFALLFALIYCKSDPVQVAAKQGAFDTSLAFIKKHLK
ncbi:hypothetical protein B0H19DRAFT_1016290 [Mycena capillaripes]|nr:hypothetical protein B0H19DRAFT_1016290 [Mycena capillaripes]